MSRPSYRRRPLGRRAVGRRIEALEPRYVLSTGPLITEFLASNDTTLTDGDGDSSDWIEVYNPTDQPIDLAGWHLTDDAGNLDKWTFPTLPQSVLDPGTYLVVFASGQDIADYVDPAGNLHTDFNLSAAGEYLAVSDPSLAVVHEYAPQFPTQSTDISYGLSFQIGETVLMDEGADARHVIPTGPIAGWNTTGYDAGSWSLGPTGIGYETAAADYAGFIETTVPAGTTSVYLRQTFDVADPASADTLTLGVRYDDGFIAFLNGTQVAQANAPASPAWNSTAPSAHSDQSAVLFEEFDISQHASLLQTTGNVLAIQLLNVNVNSSDLLIEPMLFTGQASVDMSTGGFMVAPTPGGPNNETFAGFVADTEFSVEHGFFSSPLDVEIATATAGATLVYTTDGSTPEVDAALNITNGYSYSEPIHIDATTVLRAAAFKTDFRASVTETNSYIFLQDVVFQSPNGEAPAGFPTGPVNGQVFDYGMDPNIVNNPLWGSQLEDALTQVATISLVTDAENLFDPSIGIYVNAQGHGRAWERPTSIELIDPNGGDGFQTDAGLRIRGGFSRGDFNPKHSFRLFFRGDYGDPKLNYPLFGDEGVDEFDAVDLRTAQNYAWSNDTFNNELHNTFLRDVYSRDLQREQDQAYTRSRYYQLYINGQYWGLYQTEERPEASYASSYFGGTTDDWDVVKASGVHIEATDGDLGAWSTLSNLANAGFQSDAAYYFVQGKNPDGSENPAYEKHVDVDNLIDLMTNVFFTGNEDMPTALGNNAPNNFWAIRPRDGSHGWRWIAHDNEHNLGASNHNVNYDETVPTSAGGSPTSFNPKYLHQQMMDHVEYRSQFADRVHRFFFNNGPMSTANAQALLDSRSLQINTAIIAESARWGDQHNEPPLTYNTWLAEVNWLRNSFLGQRRSIVLNQLRTDGLYPGTAYDAPSFSQHGGVVSSGFQLSIVNHEPAGTVYYTLDGSDPREPGGAIADSAVPYGDAITLSEATTVKARLLRSGNWSALVEADFLVGPLADATNLHITEVHYNPAAPTPSESAAGFTDNDEFEFIELVNSSTQTIELAGVRFVVGIDFQFMQPTSLDPGERVVLVENQAAFEMRYGTAIRVVGQYAGNLENAGESVKLTDADGNIIDEFTYDDEGDWPTATDGDGPSLVVVDTGSDYNDPANWTASANPGGSPGEAEPAAAADFDGNGYVDGDDFLIWQSGFGQFPSGGATLADGDADRDGDVDGDDFLIWQANFGAGAVGSASGRAAARLASGADALLTSAPQTNPERKIDAWYERVDYVRDGLWAAEPSIERNRAVDTIMSRWDRRPLAQEDPLRETPLSAAEKADGPLDGTKRDQRRPGRQAVKPVAAPLGERPV